MSGEEEGREAATATIPAANSSTKPWVEELPTIENLIDSKDLAIRSAQSLFHNSSTHLRTFQDSLPQASSYYKSYEDAFFSKLKEGVMIAKENPGAAVGITLTASLCLMRGPRRFLFRNTLGRFQSEEAKFSRAEKNVKVLSLSVDLMKKESSKLLERAALAEKDMKRGQKELMNSGGQIHRLAKSVYKVEAEAFGHVQPPTGRDRVSLPKPELRFDGRTARNPWKGGIETTSRGKSCISFFYLFSAPLPV
ncbi:hypothetical protein PVK06_049656 [Gossypium arboreum]|uniref:Uncharacterized protein n=1 Tax=Gossypium arboreum TaxID=29729 RepID=A0ABR0MJD1_GOSAR|nr:hypothetical protein PVK06_049656 [Gossypium arboreum]